MDVTCHSCGATFKISDQKLPPHKVIRITCPKCKDTIKIDTRKSQKDVALKEMNELEQNSSPLELFAEGTKLALVLSENEEQANEIHLVLEKLSYKPIGAQSIQEAMGKLRLHHFDFILLSDGFGGQSLDSSPIMHYLNNLSMGVRRKIFVVLLSDTFKTMDNLAAFTLSTDLVVNPSDFSKLHLILNKTISDRDKFYKVFMDTLKEVRKG